MTPKEKPSGKKRHVKARNIAPLVRQRIAEEFSVVLSSRELAEKYDLPISTVNDILHWHLRKQPESARLSVVDVFERRRA